MLDPKCLIPVSPKLAPSSDHPAYRSLKSLILRCKTDTMIIPLDQPLFVEICGADAGKILNNLTTNQVQGLEVGESVEAFVTDIRGWVVAHGIVSHVEPSRWWIVGQHPDTERVANHIDRYIIREDASITNLSGNCTLWLYLPSEGQPGDEPALLSLNEQRRLSFASFCPSAELIASSQSLDIDSHPRNNETANWDQVRIVRLWPKMGLDIWEKCIPQELDRSKQAISFTKGCYLGQETIARLDALGQIQKKLCLLKIESNAVPRDSLIFSGEKEVGWVTSAIFFEGVSWALAVIKRGFFAEGTNLVCNGEPAVIVQPKGYCP